MEFNGTYSCGHSGSINVTGPIQYAQWFAEKKFEKICPDCQKIKGTENRKQTLKENRELSEILGLPPLEGTRRQTDWALSLRIDFIHAVEDALKEFEEMDFKEIKSQLFRAGGRRELKLARNRLLNNISTLEEFKEQALGQLDRMMCYCTSASYWIGYRNNNIWTNLLDELTKYTIDSKRADTREIELEILKEGAASAPHPSFPGIVRIYTSTDEIRILYGKPDALQQILRPLFYTWKDGIWFRQINELSGTLEDRAVEAGARLLKGGFKICYMDRNLRDKALLADYLPENTRWIILVGEQLGIWWREENTRLYQAARRLTKARWKNPYIVMELKYFEEVEEFAELFDFQYTKEARSFLDLHKQQLDAVLIGDVADLPIREYADGLSDMLQSETRLIEDLIDDDFKITDRTL